METLRLTIASLIVLACSSHAQIAPAPRAVEVRFVPPGGEGTVSLGIFDDHGKLVRVLCDEWTFNRFRIGLNGLAVTWDGLDSAGQPVPPGVYDAGGFVVGDVEIAGEAVHFNDWIESADSPQIVAVAGAQVLPDSDVLLAARMAGGTGALIRYSPDRKARWRTVVSEPRPQPAQDVQLAVSDTMAFVLLDGLLRAIGISDGTEVKLPMPLENTRAVAARGSQLAVLDDKAIRFFAQPDFTPQQTVGNLPARFVSIALLDSGTVAASDNGQLWLWQGAWSRIDLPEDMKVRRVSAGRGQTFWALEENTTGALSVAQYSPEEGNLARWTPAKDEGKITWIAGSPGNDVFVAAVTNPSAQRTLAIRRKDAGGWEYVFDKKITACANFGWADGNLSPGTGDLPAAVTADLGDNPLDPAAPRTLALRAFSDATGTGLSAADGLPLLRVLDGPGFPRVMMVAGQAPNTVRFFQGNGACVEEFVVSNLAAITAFDAGEIRMTSAGEASPPPVQDPDDSKEAPQASPSATASPSP